MREGPRSDYCFLTCYHNISQYTGEQIASVAAHKVQKAIRYDNAGRM
ncbi:hypothetical protein M7I_0688 [Glarea lozoyensis 74030]|uniref:Uncharacterized protein n=1 Tax=Glarea lozoyensis (strain ATCC 74030 / MF5533) TaxID=1104152 RepID=H0EE20_GLAL7|nr:hypothetical protein M7I_0688 [Glarea lozoyensis 74030]